MVDEGVRAALVGHPAHPDRVGPWFGRR